MMTHAEIPETAVPGEPFTTPENAAREAGIDPESLVRLLESGEIYGEKLDGDWLVTVSEAFRALELQP